MKDRYIPEELIADDILPRLPVKSLMKFRYVCKAWHSTISNHDFIKSHRHHSQSKVHVVHWSNDIQDETSSINLERLTEGGNLQHSYRLPVPRLNVNDIINSSHDLVVLYHKDGYLLSNPAMQESLYLPYPASWFGALFPVVGFGFVSSLEKYKVVIISSNIETEDTCTEVFTVGMDNSWRIGKTPPSSIYPHGHTPYVNGNLHMLTWRNDKGENSKILIFNLEKETWTVMTLPNHPRIPKYSIYLKHTELRDIHGLLCFTCCFKNKSIDIWVLRDYENEVWSKDFVIDMAHPRVIPNGVNFRIPQLYGWFPLSVMDDGRILLHTESSIDDRLFYYDPQDGSIQLADHEGRCTTLYAENLVPISGF